MVLIHGAWQGSWAFEAWMPMLQAAGWQVHAVDLPGNGIRQDAWPPAQPVRVDLDAYVAHVAELLAGLDGPAVVLGHSGGGITASQVAEHCPERVLALVYLAGMMLPDGMDFGALIEACRREQPGFVYAGIGPHLEWDAMHQASRVPPAAAGRIFLHDCTPEQAAAATRRLCWQPEGGRAMRCRLTAQRYGRVPRIYVECLRDRSVLHELQRCMQNLSPGALRITLDCGHVPQLACPALLTERLLPALAQMLPSGAGTDLAVASGRTGLLPLA
ncbi:alpha/beta hydrolase [Corticibacter populi]|uniref:Alpha/beta hydrolase n=2 Tax=Corticibacter populi TaxID=1550736 RepID=A0A3M6R0Z1_9BURK|nr:alpha/beta hydrolase [Corticibacter populi]